MITRRNLLVSLSAALVTPRLLLAAPPAPRRIYIGTGNRGPGAGILTADWNPATGEIGEITLAAEVSSPTFLAQFRRPDGETSIYAVTEESGPAAKVSAFTTTPGQKTLKLLNQVPTQGAGPTYVSVSPDGRTVLVANYGGGSVSSFHANPDGALSEAVSPLPVLRSRPRQGTPGHPPHPLRPHLPRRPFRPRQRPRHRPHHDLPPQPSNLGANPHRPALLHRPPRHRPTPPRLEPQRPLRLLLQ